MSNSIHNLRTNLPGRRLAAAVLTLALTASLFGVTAHWQPVYGKTAVSGAAAPTHEGYAHRATARAPLSPASGPGSPTHVLANPANRSASVSWSSPNPMAGSRVVSYKLTPSPSCPACTGLQTSSTAVIVRSLSNNRTYRFTVTAVVAGVPGPASPSSNAVTPRLQQPTINLVEPNRNVVASFALRAVGNAGPLSTLSGRRTKLKQPEAITFDGFGRLYVASPTLNRVTEYSVGAGGAAAPVKVLQGRATELSQPSALTVSANNRLYVANQARDTITVYRYGAAGNAAPMMRIKGSRTKLHLPQGITVGPDGRLYVANANNTITEYSRNASGNARPTAVIAGKKTLLSSPHSLLVDDAGRLLVADPGSNAVTTYAPHAHGNVSPVRSLRGPRTGLSGNFGIDFDTAGNLYAANSNVATVTEYAPTANGNAAPLATIAGSLTGIKQPRSIALSPPFAVTSSPILPTTVNGRSFRATLRTDLGTTPYSWNLISGKLPTGLHLLRSGSIFGTPSEVGTFHFTVKVTDSSSPRQTATRRMTLRIS